MATYTSEPVTVARTPAELAEKFSDFSVLQQRLDEMPQEMRQKVGEVEFTADSIIINTPQVGQIQLQAIERTPSGVVLEAKNSPVPMKLKVKFDAEGEDSSRVQGAIEVDIPMVLKPLIGPTMQKAADQFGKLFSSLA